MQKCIAKKIANNNRLADDYKINICRQAIKSLTDESNEATLAAAPRCEQSDSRWSVELGTQYHRLGNLFGIRLKIKR